MVGWGWVVEARVVGWGWVAEARVVGWGCTSRHSKSNRWDWRGWELWPPSTITALERQSEQIGTGAPPNMAAQHAHSTAQQALQTWVGVARAVGWGWVEAARTVGGWVAAGLAAGGGGCRQVGGVVFELAGAWGLSQRSNMEACVRRRADTSLPQACVPSAGGAAR